MIYLSVGIKPVFRCDRLLTPEKLFSMQTVFLFVTKLNKKKSVLKDNY